MKDVLTTVTPADVLAPHRRRTSALWSCERHQELRFADADGADGAAAGVGECRLPRRIRVVRDDDGWPALQAVAQAG